MTWYLIGGILLTGATVCIYLGTVPRWLAATFPAIMALEAFVNAWNAQ
jgi:hypothetical protein